MSDEVGSNPEQPIEGPAEEIVPASEVISSEDDARSLWNRRTLFKSAALGAAAAAMYEGGRAVFSPLVAYANDLSTLPCTANDVEIIGTGIVVNEPCVCTGTFDAQVVFRVRNNTSTGRYCISVHLSDGRDILLFAPDGTSTAFGKAQGEDFRDTIMTGTLANFPCGAGLVCFGQPGEIRGKCDPGTCSTVAWSTSPNQANCMSPDPTPPGGQCRHQRICIQGRGATTIACPAAGCDLPCGGSIGLTVCTTEAAAFGPFIFQLVSGGVVVQSFGPTTDTCHTFTVSPTSDTTYLGRVISTADDPDCVHDSAAVTVRVTSVTVTLGVSGNVGCTLGNLRFTATLGTACTDPAGATFAFSVDGNVVQTGPSNTYDYPADPDTVCHTVSVVATCGACVSKAASRTVSQCVQTTVDC
jgi:hypothetical protein